MELSVLEIWLPLGQSLWPKVGVPLCPEESASKGINFQRPVCIQGRTHTLPALLRPLLTVL